MNIKDNIKEVKRELSSDEQMLASAFRLEKLYKKHKIKIFIALGALVIFFGGNGIYDAIESYRLNGANEAYLTLQKDPNNKEALKTLESKNPKLFELYNYKMIVESGDIKLLKGLLDSRDEYISDISRYHLSVLDEKVVDSTLYRDFALLNGAIIYIKDGKIEKARDRLSLIDEKSPIYNISKLIKHYTIKGK